MQSNQTINPAVIIPSKQEVKARLQKEIEAKQQHEYFVFATELIQELEKHGKTERLIQNTLRGNTLLHEFVLQLKCAGWNVRCTKHNIDIFLNVS